MGNPKDAIAILERIPPGTLSGEWASQALMMRGTNLLLAGRISEALQALHSSTGEGTPYTRSIAHDLLSTAKWYSGDPIGAIDEADQAERLALNSTTTWIARQRTAWKACLFAATGQLSLAESLLSQYHRESGDEETEAIVRIAEVLLLCERNEIEEAHDLLAKTDVPARATRAATWKASLGIALAFSENGELLDGQGEDLAMQLAGAAGHAAARHLSGGALAKSVHRPYLPTSWCEPDASSTRVRLTGASGISRDGVAVEHRSWARNRVRELLLHLVLVENATRSLVAASLWPDLLDRDAGRNLRVTLTHLLDVLDPERAPASGSSFIVDTEGTLSLNRSSGLWVDIWEHDQYAVALLMTPDHERQTLLAHARRLVGFAWGPLLGGIALGEWVEPHTRRRNELRISALLRGGSHALAAAEYKLAEVLALSAMDVDPWSQQAHNLLIESRIDVGDMDGARRAFTQAIETFRDLGVTPVFPVSSISHRLGLSFTA
jgi:DNA-binding SARP family transcriptional activator